MSWGYWGIGTGLVVLVATLFMCLEQVYSSSKKSPDTSLRLVDQPGEMSKETPTSSRLTA
jgi:hypothetical protein